VTAYGHQGNADVENATAGDINKTAVPTATENKDLRQGNRDVENDNVENDKATAGDLNNAVQSTASGNKDPATFVQGNEDNKETQSTADGNNSIANNNSDNPAGAAGNPFAGSITGNEGTW